MELHQFETPGGGDAHGIVLGLARRLRLTRIERHHDRVLVAGAFAFVNALVSIAAMSAVAWATGEAFVFPSLGPTAFLLFYRPLSPASSPRNTICGHAIGVLSGYAALAAFGLTGSAAATTTGVAPARIGAVALSLALTAGGMVWLSVPHPPAGATTLIVSLGILHTPPQLAVLMVGVVLITAQGFAINRLSAPSRAIRSVALWGGTVLSPFGEVRGGYAFGAKSLSPRSTSASAARVRLRTSRARRWRSAAPATSCSRT